jgi:succinate dehydrogenase/fumarate reductase-like Fe-S protein
MEVNGMLRVSVWRGAREGRFEAFEVPRRPSQTVLDVVTHIQRHSIPPSPIASRAASACAAPAR